MNEDASSLRALQWPDWTWVTEMTATGQMRPPTACSRTGPGASAVPHISRP